jgi:hypothetical protein
MVVSKPNYSNDNFRRFALASTDHLATTAGSKSLEHRDDIITNSLVISGCGGRSMAMVYITSLSEHATSCSNSVCAVR